MIKNNDLEYERDRQKIFVKLALAQATRRQIYCAAVILIGGVEQ